MDRCCDDVDWGCEQCGSDGECVSCKSGFSFRETSVCHDDNPATEVTEYNMGTYGPMAMQVFDINLGSSAGAEYAQPVLRVQSFSGNAVTEEGDTLQLNSQGYSDYGGGLMSTTRMPFRDVEVIAFDIKYGSSASSLDQTNTCELLRIPTQGLGGVSCADLLSYYACCPLRNSSALFRPHSFHRRC